MPIEGNDMELGEFQVWAERGASLRDAAMGLTFKACEVAERRRKALGQDHNVDLLLEVAKVALLADIAETLRTRL